MFEIFFDGKCRIWNTRKHSKRILRNKSYVTYSAFTVIFSDKFSTKDLNKQTSSEHGNSFETNSKSYYVIEQIQYRRTVFEIYIHTEIKGRTIDSEYTVTVNHDDEPHSRLYNHLH